MFEAMYYPYTSINNEQTLKKSLFYLDKIYVLTPDESTIAQNRSDLLNLKRGGLSFGSLFNRVNENEIREIIEPIHPSDILDKYEDKLSLSIAEDLKDSKFRKSCNQTDYWMLYYDKLPRALGVHFESKILERQGEYVKVERDFGESILLNYVIYACLDKKISPLTDEPEHSRILTYKMNRNYDRYRNFLYELGYIEDLKQQLLVKKVIEKHLYGLENVDAADIIGFRETHKKELKRFTVEIGKISTQIQSKPFDLELESEISQIVTDKIDPSIEELNMSIQDFREELVKRSVRKILPTVLTFSISAYSAGWEIGILSSMLVNLIPYMTQKDSMDLVGALLDYWQQDRRFKRNSLHYLIEAEKEFK